MSEAVAIPQQVCGQPGMRGLSVMMDDLGRFTGPFSVAGLGLPVSCWQEFTLRDNAGLWGIDKIRIHIQTQL